MTRETTRKPIAAKLTPETLTVLDAAAERMGWSRAATLEVLIRTAAPNLNQNTTIPAGAMPGGARAPGQKRSRHRTNTRK